MLGLMICLFILMCMLWIGFKLTGALLLAMFWLFIQVPIGLFLIVLGILFCCTLILIPVGVTLFKAGFRMLIPGV